jgi:predicted ATPase
MFLSKVNLKNWRNFRHGSIRLRERMFIVGPNASGKSNFLDIFRFMRDIVKRGGGLQKALKDRGGLSKVRCLSARKDPEVELEFHFSESVEDETPVWKYKLSLEYEGKGRQRAFIAKEEVWKGEDNILSRPDKNDEQDPWRKTETNLEQLNANADFRAIFDFFNDVHYFHIVPQLLKHPDVFFKSNISKEEDAYGFHFLERIIDTSKKIQDSRLKKIEEALRIAVPQLRGLSITRDERGVPHLESIYEHWRPRAGKQQEDQFSDGTLRLIGFLWSILETNSILLLEEPELSLNSAIISRLPPMIYKITRSKKKKQQIMISTHSPDLLMDKGISGEEVLLMIPKREGTDIRISSSIDEIRVLLENGMSPAEVIVPYTKPKNIEQLSFQF